jgi:hypothetical protein
MLFREGLRADWNWLLGFAAIIAQKHENLLLNGYSCLQSPDALRLVHSYLSAQLIVMNMQ